jgi:hypothetical protein
MIHLDEIKQLREKGKRKYGKALLYYIEPKINAGYSYLSIVKWLKEEHDIVTTENAIGKLRLKYLPEIKDSKGFKDLGTRKESSFEKIVQNKERKTVIVPLKEQSPDEIKESFFSMMDDEINKVPSPFERLIKK